MSRLPTTRTTETVLPDKDQSKVIIITDAETLRQIVREELRAEKAFAPAITEDRQLNITEFKEKFKIKSYAGIYSLRRQGCPFTGEGKSTRISEQAAIQWFSNRNKSN